MRGRERGITVYREPSAWVLLLLQPYMCMCPVAANESRSRWARVALRLQSCCRKARRVPSLRLSACICLHIDARKGMELASCSIAVSRCLPGLSERRHTSSAYRISCSSLALPSIFVSSLFAPLHVFRAFASVSHPGPCDRRQSSVASSLL